MMTPMQHSSQSIRVVQRYAEVSPTVYNQILYLLYFNEQPLNVSS